MASTSAHTQASIQYIYIIYLTHTHAGIPVTFRWTIRVANWAVNRLELSSSSVCLFFCFRPTSLKKRYCISWRRLQWKQVRSNTRKYALYILTCIPKWPSMPGTQTRAPDSMYLNSLTATAWLTVSNGQVRQTVVPFWYHRSKQVSLYTLAMIPGTPCMLESWKHPNENRCVGTPEVPLKLSFFGLLHAKHNAQNRALLRAHPLPDFTISWSIYIH